jgi:DNA-binding XRE family transcriptional regulator
MLPVQCRMARAALGLSVKKLAVAARVAPQTIVRFERGEKIRASTVKFSKPLAWSSPTDVSLGFV